MIRGWPGLEICSTIGRLGSSGSSAADSGGFAVPSGRSITASAVTFPARSPTDIRTFNASAVPASHHCAADQFHRARIGTRRHTPTPSIWYSSTSDLGSRYWSLTSHRTAPDAAPTVRFQEQRRSHRVHDDFQVRLDGRVHRRRDLAVDGQRLDREPVFAVMLGERKLKGGWSGNVLLTARHLYPEFSETRRLTSLIRFCAAAAA